MEAVKPKKKSKAKRVETKRETSLEPAAINEEIPNEFKSAPREEIPADPVHTELLEANETVSTATEEIPEAKEEISQTIAPPLVLAEVNVPLPVVIPADLTEVPAVSTSLLSGKVKIYPEVPTEQLKSPAIRMRKQSVMILPPYTEAQLRSFYSNPVLDVCEQFTDDFIRRELDHSTGDPQWESLLDTYATAFRKYEDIMHTVKDLDSHWDNYAESIWTLSQKVVTHKGKCEEGKEAEGSAKYPVATFNTDVAEKLKETVDALRDTHAIKSTGCNYDLQVAKLRCQSYVDQLVAASVVLFENFSIHPSAPPAVDFSSCSEFLELRQRLTTCLSVSFGFLRRSGLPGEIERKIRIWTEALVSVLVRIGSPTDHFYLFNQLLRCPATVGEWAVGFVQPLQSQVPNGQERLCIDHFVAELSLLLSPIRQREEFLKQLIQHELNTRDVAWTVVTNDGDEDEGYMMLVQESDLLLYLNQFSFDRLFLLFLQTQCNSSTGLLSESQVLSLIAFELSLLKILYEGIRSYGFPRYNAFCKQLGYVMRQTVQYVGEYWLECRSRMVSQGFPFDKISRLQQEFDRMLFRAVSYIISARNLGVWQFIVDLPFSSLSIDYLWKVLYVLIEDEEINRQAVLSTPTEALVENLLDESQLDLVLSDMTEMDAVYLMTALSNMASAASDLKFVTVVTDKIFKTAFITPSGRDLYYKTGRNCIGAICQRHKLMIGILLKRIDSNAEALGQFALEVLSEAPLHEWNLGLSELAVLKTWLMMETKSLLGNLARKILASLTYSSYTKEDSTVVSGSAQFFIAEIISEAHQKHIHQVAKSDQTFSLFCWELLTALELHNCHQVKQKCLASGVIANGLIARDPSAMYVALCSLYAHDVEGFLQEGLDMLQSLVKLYLYKPAIIASLKVLMMHSREAVLTQSSKFVAILAQLVHADETYSQYVKSFIVTEFPGLHTNLMGSFLYEQVSSKEFIPISEVDPFCATLTQMLLKCGKKQQWNRDRNVCYLLNQLVRLCFTCEPSLVLLKRVFTDELKNLVNGDSKAPGKGLWGWFSSSNTELLPESEFAEFPWLAFLCVSVEEAMLADSVTTLELTALRNPGHSLQKLLKELDKSVGLSLETLPVYRFLQLVSAMDSSHPLLVIVGQKILQPCLRRIITDDPALPKANLGVTYYNCPQLQAKFSKLRFLIADAKLKSSGLSGDVLNGMLSWLDDKRLYSPYTNLASLTDVPCKDHLIKLVNGELGLWLDLVPFDQIRNDCELQAKQFAKLSSLAQFWRSASVKSDPDANGGRLGPAGSLRRLQDRLRTAPLKTVSPPQWTSPTDILSMEPDSVLVDVGRTIELVRKDLEIITKAARKYGEIVATMISLDVYFMDQIPNLYQKMQSHVPVMLKCSAGLLQTCRGPSSVKIPVMASKINTGVKETITKNRQAYNEQILQLSRLMSLEMVKSAGHSSNLVSRLVWLKMFNQIVNAGGLQTTGVSLFHHLLQSLSSTVLQFPASSSLLTQLVELTGNCFIMGNPTQVEILFNLIVQNPGYDRFLVPLFNPQCADNVTYVRLYQQLGELCSQANQKISDHIRLSLLSKFLVDKFLLAAQLGDVQKLSNVSYSLLILPSISAQLYQSYLSHWLSCFRFQFPSMLEFSIQQLLTGCETQKIRMDVLEAVLLKLAINQKTGATDTVTVSTHECERLIAVLTCSFTAIRSFGDNHAGSSIYTKLGSYVTFFAPLMEFLIQSVVVKRTNHPQAVSYSWEEMVRLYGSWLEPNNNASPPIAIWNVDESPMAEQFLKGFVTNVATLQKLYGATSCPSPLAVTWMYYNHRLATVSPSYVYGILHRHFLTLPWHELLPTLEILESFQWRLSSYNKMSSGFITDLLVRIPWVQRDCELYFNSPDRQMCRWLLFDCVCRCACSPENYANCKASFPRLLEEIQAIPWSDMPHHKLCETFEYLLSHLDPGAILMEDDTTEAIFLRFLRFAVGFVPNYDTTVVQARTARLFVKLVISCMVGCCVRSQANVADRICDLLLCLVADIELISRTVLDTSISLDIADLLLQELVVFWNLCSDVKCSDSTIAALLRWMAKYPDAKTILPLMKQISLLWVDTAKLTAFLELGMTSYFTAGEAANSLLLVSTLRQQPHLVPKISSETIRTGSFLVLSLLLKQQLIACTALSEETDVIRQVLSVLTMAKTSVFEESKILLLIKLACVLMVRHYEFGAKAETAYPLLKEIMGLLDYFAQEPSGFLSAFGLSRKQNYSSKFKLVCHLSLGFISQQIIDEKSVRLDPNVAVLHSRLALLKSLRREKQFQKFGDVLDGVAEYFTNTEKHLGSLNEFLCRVFTLLQMEQFLQDPY